MLKLFICSNKQRIVTIDGCIFNVLKVFAITNFWKRELSNYPMFYVVENVDFFFKICGFSFRIEITPRLKKVIVDFLNNRDLKRKPGFDCYSLASSFCNLPKHKKRDLNLFWELKPLKTWREVGDVIFFMDYDTYFHHAAIYIGFGLYISVFDDGGNIEISRLEDIRVGFKARNIYLAVPRL